MVYGNQFPQVILYTVIISLGLGFLNLFIVNIAPRLSARLGFYCSMALLITVGVLLLVLYDRYIRVYLDFGDSRLHSKSSLPFYAFSFRYGL